MNASGPRLRSTAGAGKLDFVLASVLIDVLGIGLIIPVTPALVGAHVPGRDEQALEVSHLAPGDWRIGSSFYLAAGMQALAVLGVLAALRCFRQRQAGALSTE